MENFKAGTYINQKYYKSFQPEKINRVWNLQNRAVSELFNEANNLLGKLDMYSEYVPNIDLFISMHVVKEATQSSKIEGTKTNIAEALLEKEDVVIEKRDDWEEVQNYIMALNTAITALEELPFSSRLIKQTHKILLQGVRGKHKLPGDFRSSQNWIGGATLSDAIFVPPVHTSVDECMSDLEKFAHNEDFYFPDLLKIALIHYQFETIHPFLDGNGRVGRLLIPLFLIEKGVLKKPVLYLSDFFEKHRTLYYDNLMRVREKNDIVQWFKFFLVGIIETTKNSITTFDGILKLQKEIDYQLSKSGSRFGTAKLLVEQLYQHPIVDAQKVTQMLGISLPSAYKLLKTFEKQGIITVIKGGGRRKLYFFERYVQLFQ